MSLTAEKKHFKNELTAGVHLVSIFDLKIHKDSNKQPIVKDGEMALVVTFVTGTNPNLYHEQIYWIGKGKEGKERYFTQMCLDAMIDMSVTPMPKKAALNKRLWVAIRDVFTLVDNGANTKKDILGNDIVERFIFHTAPIWDVEKPPTWKGDPIKNDGVACDDFVGYVEDNEDGYSTMSTEAPEPFTLEVKAVTPEVESVMEVKPKKAIKKAKSLVEIIAPMQEQKDIVEYQMQAKLHNATTSTPMPNFGSETVTDTPQFSEGDIVLTEEEIEGAHHVDNVLHEGSDMPNFGDDETPDTNF
jgi:hypothetical protein